MSARPDPTPCARPARRTGRGRSDGFTLIEVLVAFTVLSLLMMVMFRGAVTMRAGSAAFDDRTHIDVVARAVLEDALAKHDLADGRYKGVRDGRSWTIVASPIDLTAQLPSPPPPEKAAPGQPPAPARADESLKWTTQRLVVTVATGGRPLQVETIRLVKAKPASGATL